MLKSMMDQLLAMRSHYARVTALRIDLAESSYQGTSERLSVFLRRFRRRLAAKYGVTKLGYCWCREQERAKAQHYHLMFFIDGRLVQQAWGVQQLAKEIWQDLGGGTFYAPKRHYNITRIDGSELSKAVYRLSYLAKCRGKGYKPEQAKNYGTSRLSNHQ